jgi:hypothetical protein
MRVTILLCIFITAFIFYIGPQLAKFRSVTGITKKLDDDRISLAQKAWLMMLGLKTPFVNTLAMLFSFLATEGDSLRAFNWEQFISHEHAVWVATGLWVVSLWTHFSGLNAAAAMSPINAPSLPVPPKV